jgi:hypothetical protein
MKETNVLHVGQLGSGRQFRSASRGLPAVRSASTSRRSATSTATAATRISQQTNGDDAVMMDGDNSTADVAPGRTRRALQAGTRRHSMVRTRRHHLQHDNGLDVAQAATPTRHSSAVGPFNPARSGRSSVGDFDGDGKDDLIWQHDGGQRPCG